MAKFKRNLITTALPYANGPVHIGHLAGVYVPADIYVRYLRQKGEEVVFIGGSDEHGVPITIKAQKEGVTPQDIVDRYHQIIKDSFEEFGISFDIYSRTSSKTHHELSSAFFKKLYDEGKFIEKTSMQFYDEKAGQFLADRYIVGKCPHCGNERAPPNPNRGSRHGAVNHYPTTIYIVRKHYFSTLYGLPKSILSTNPHSDPKVNTSVSSL